VEPAEIEKTVGDLEVAVDRLRSLYEQYFMGIEKLEPTVPRKDVDRRIYALRKEQIRNTAQRFRFQMILQRYNVYQTHWQRICREIENGTYKRHLLRAERRFGDGAPADKRPSALAEAGAKPAFDLAKELAELDADFAPPPAEEEISDADLLLEEERPPPVSAPPMSAPPRSVPVPPSVAPRKAPMWRKAEPTAPRQSWPPPPQAAPSRPQPSPVVAKAPGSAPMPSRAPAAAPTTTGDDLPEARVRQIYSQYVEAKRRGNESTAAITYEAVAKSLRESSAKLRQKHGKAVDFEVAVKDGKAILKPVIK
jgi:hypothetical protein